MKKPGGSKKIVAIKPDVTKPAVSPTSSGTSVHFDADSSAETAATENTTFNFHPALKYGDDLIKQAPSNFTALDNRLSQGHVIGLDIYKRKLTEPEIKPPNRVCFPYFDSQFPLITPNQHSWLVTNYFDLYFYLKYTPVQTPVFSFAYCLSEEWIITSKKCNNL